MKTSLIVQFVTLLTVKDTRMTIVDELASLTERYPGRRLWSSYTLVTACIRSRYDRKRPYFAVLHGLVLRSYISVIVYGAIRPSTTVYIGKRRSHMASVY